MNDRDSKYPLCRHTKTNGLRCQSPAMGAGAFCYHHRKLYRPSRPGAGPGYSTHTLHTLRNARDVQETLAMLTAGLLSGRIDPKAAAPALSALRLASTNVFRSPLK